MQFSMQHKKCHTKIVEQSFHLSFVLFFHSTNDNDFNSIAWVEWKFNFQVDVKIPLSFFFSREHSLLLPGRRTQCHSSKHVPHELLKKRNLFLSSSFIIITSSFLLRNLFFFLSFYLLYFLCRVQIE
jgi:hypothetical protein